MEKVSSKTPSPLPPYLPINLTIRFSASLPDLPLQIPHPTSTNTCGLKQLVRSSLPLDLSNHRLRLIYAGHALIDAAPLSTSLRLRPPTRTAPNLSTTTGDSSKEKGKTPVYPSSSSFSSAPTPTPIPTLADSYNDRERERYFIHCSIGDIVLPPSDLAAEAAVANPLSSASTSTSTSTPSTFASNTKPSLNLNLNPIATSLAGVSESAPRGFARLPLSPTSLSSLRTTFARHLSSTTPHPLSPSSLLRAEDEWLDNTNVGAPLTGTNPDGGGGGEAAAGPLDDLLWGATMGFFWPVACLWWVGREEGVWSRRRRVAVGLGGLVNLVFGVLRWVG